MKNSLATLIGIVILCLLCTGIMAGGQKDTLDVVALTDSLGFSPTIPGNAPNQWFYAISAPPDTAVADSIPVQFTLNDTNSAPESSPYTVTLKAVGPLAGAITFDNASFSISDGQSLTAHINLNTTQLPAGDYIGNVQVAATPQSGVTVAHDTIHILLHLAPPGSYSCFVTDSSGLLLQDCSGQSVNTGGAFSIVSNGKKATATNPGQFYYNLLWTNTTGTDQSLTFSLSAANVVPVGKNSVHLLVYDANQFTYDFDDVNQIGTPCGQMGSTCVSVPVPNGQTLWLTWHVAYQWIGSPIWSDIPNASACPTTSAHGTIAMSISAQNADDSVSILCTASANGYRK